MPVPIHLGSLRLLSLSTGLDLALTSNASISTLAQSYSFDTPSITDIESGRVWLAPTTNVKLLLTVVWPSFTSDRQNNALRRSLLTALHRAAVSTTSRQSASIQLTNLYEPVMEPVEPSTLLDCRAFAMSKHMFPCHIIDSCILAYAQEETANSSSWEGCAMQSS
jgi:hypothetical protein